MRIGENKVVPREISPLIPKDFRCWRRDFFMHKDSLNEENITNSDIGLLIVGQGTMGKAMTTAALNQTERVKGLSRDSESYDELVRHSQVIVLATKQFDGLNWLKQYGGILNKDQIIISLMGFVDFKTLELTLHSEEVKVARMMTNTGLDKIVWSDDGRFEEKDTRLVTTKLSWLSQDVEYIGQRNDEAILKETLRACLLGWVAQDLASDVEALERVFGYSADRAEAEVTQMLILLLRQKNERCSYRQCFQAVATKGGVTETGAGLIGEDLQNLHQNRLLKGLEKAWALEEGFYQQAINAIIN